MGKFVRQPPQVFDEALLVVGGEVDEYHIFLGFYGDLLDPNAITSAIGRSPTSAAVKGDIVHKNEHISKYRGPALLLLLLILVTYSLEVGEVQQGISLMSKCDMACQMRIFACPSGAFASFG